MSDITPLSAAAPESTPAPKPSRHRIARVFGWLFITIAVILLVAIFGLNWYTHTEDFQRRVGGEVKSVLEDSTGGKVDIGHIGFDLWRLAIEVDNLVIHGTEGPGQAPYLSAAKVLLRLKLNTFLSHTVGKGPQQHVGLNYLRVEQPHAHLIIDKDGKTNQPVPKTPSTSTEPLQNTLLDLQAKEVELVDGLVLVNDRPIPFNVAARDLNANVRYLSDTDRYGISVSLADLQTQMQQLPVQHSKLDLAMQLGRNMAELSHFNFYTGMNSHLEANAAIQNFAHPDWKADVTGGIALPEIGLLGGVDGLTSGVLRLDVHGHNCDVTPQQAQQNPGQYKKNNEPVPPRVTKLPPTPNCDAGYLLLGNINIHDGGYRNANVNLHNVNAQSQLRVTPTELLFTALTGYLPGGGRVDGELKIENWLGEVPADAPATSPTTVAAAKTANTTAKNVGAAPPVQSVTNTQVQRAHAFAKVTVKGITLRTVMEITGNKINDLGLDTQVSGPVTAEWGGPATNIADTVQVEADLSLSPTGARRAGVQNTPVSGRLKAHYDGGNQLVRFEDVHLNAPGTTLVTTGTLALSGSSPRTDLAVNLQAKDLSQFDSVLRAAGVSSNGKQGTAALPVALNGALSFNGTVKGPLSDVDVKGHIQANDLRARLSPTSDIHIDSVNADAEYSPSRGVAITNAIIQRGTATLKLAGTLRPHRVVSRNGTVSYKFDNAVGIDTNIDLANAQVPDLLQIAGIQQTVPITGTVDVHVHVNGTLKNLNGGGHIQLNNGVAYGEPYKVIAVDAVAQGQQINASRIFINAQDAQLTADGSYNLTSKQADVNHLLLTSGGNQITGAGTYNVGTERLTAKISGQNIQLSTIDYLAKNYPGYDARINLNLSADGTAKQPNLQAKISADGVTVQGKMLGALQLAAHSQGTTAYYNLTSQLVGAQIAAEGQTSLTGDYQTDAKLTLAGVDVAKAVQLFAPGSTDATSDIAGVVTVHGPAAKPMLLAGSATFSSFAVTTQGITLRQTEPIHLALNNGVVTIDSLRLAGPDTTLHVTGSATVLGDNNPNGGTVNVHADGNLNLALAHTLDPQLITSGHVTLDAGVQGRIKAPVLTGQVRFDNANLAVDGIPNGLSNLQGTAVFNQNRLELNNITATSGGGKITLGGYVGYQRGLFSDLSVKVDHVRVRYAGLSTTADATIRLQGGGQALFLSGNVLITRFNIGPDVDFARFAGTGGISIPPDPTSLLNKIRMDVHVASSPQLDFQNSYAKIAGTVDLNVRGTVAVPSILGTVRITDGSATFAGTTYQLERGVIYFTDPVRINPIIDLDVTTRVSNYNVTIGVHGDTTNLKPIYRSSPPLTEADIFNLLALGKTQEQSQIANQQEVQAGTDPTTSAILSGALNATLGSRVSKLFGAGSVKIDPSYTGTLGNSYARITVQEPLTDQLTLVFATNLNQSAQQLIQVQYQLSDNTTIVATRDEVGVFSIVYRVRKRYK